MVPIWEGMDTINQWPQLCSMAQVGFVHWKEKEFGAANYMLLILIHDEASTLFPQLVGFVEVDVLVSYVLPT